MFKRQHAAHEAIARHAEEKGEAEDLDLTSFRKHDQYGPDTIGEEKLKDLLIDLLHLAERNGLDVTQLAASALSIYDMEQAESQAKRAAREELRTQAAERYKQAQREALESGAEPSPESPAAVGEVTPKEFGRYPVFYLYDEYGRKAAEASRCEHGYGLLDSCPGCGC